MADTGLFNNVYNPDVLSCLANLSNDEVFTPPDVVNDMLDMLPQELFQNPDTNRCFSQGNCQKAYQRTGAAVPGLTGAYRPHLP
jgi:hypothetical protein